MERASLETPIRNWQEMIALGGGEYKRWRNMDGTEILKRKN